MVYHFSSPGLKAHRYVGELIVYEGIRRPSVRRLSTFSNDISSEADSFHISHIAFIGRGNS